MRPKRLDIFIIRSFLLLFVAAFCICLFVLLMNILWRYVEDLVGKGLTFGIIARFFFLFGTRLVPEALPLAVLMASLITFGNFGERLELLAMKTAGIPLLRIMRPLTIFCVLLAGLSFYFQNVVVPNKTQKLFSLIVSINQKSPELEIPEGTFYDQISGYNLYVNHKDLKSGMLYDVIIYDHSQGYENLSVTLADSAFLETTADEKHIMLHLFAGVQFRQDQDMEMDSNGDPYIRENFRQQDILLDFDSGFTQTDEGLMSTQAESKNMAEIRHTIDSLSARQDSIGLGNLSEYRYEVNHVVSLQRADSLKLLALAGSAVNGDSLFNVASREGQLDIRTAMKKDISFQANDLTAKNINMAGQDRSIRKHWISWMRKIVNSISILIFFFIGAPLGAIIRKGGLGVPVIVSVLTYILFYVTSASGEKMFREGMWSIVGCWFSTIVLAPLSVFFTVKANGDSTVFQPDVILEFLRHWFGGKVSRNITRKDVVIDEPDPKLCLELAGEICNLSDKVLDSEVLSARPKYSALFFREENTFEIDNLFADCESLVMELGNSRDRIELDKLNCLPVIPVYGIKSPFKARWANVACGIVVPLGVLMSLRAWLFGMKIRKLIVQTREVAADLADYMNKTK